MTKLEALKLTETLWAFLAETGLEKDDFKEFDLKKYANLCPLCEWAQNEAGGRRLGACALCPLEPCSQQDDGLFIKWVYAIGEKQKKKTANALLQKIKAIIAKEEAKEGEL